jgi:hypothetical protein
MDENRRSKGQYASFYMGSIEDAEATAREGRPIFKDVPFVRIHIAGDKDNIIDQPVWDAPHKENSHTARFPEEWARFKQGMDEEAQQGGTPLALMPGITNGQVRELAHFKCRTVEQLSDMSDANCAKFPGIQKLRAAARVYIERAAGAAPEKRLQAQLEERDNKIATLERQMGELLARGGGDKPAAPAPVVEVEAPPPPAPKPTKKSARVAA